jgi:protein arginine N-methyltransferase 1
VPRLDRPHPASQAAALRASVGDRARTEAYRRAIASAVQPGDVVVDVSTGSGILAVFAAQAGASVVHAVEQGTIIEQARQVAETSGQAERIVFHHADASELELDVEADVLICDWVGGFVFSTRVFPAAARLRDRCLKPDGVMIPGAVKAYFAPVCDPELRARGPELWAERPGDVDLSCLRDAEYQCLTTESQPIHPARLIAPAASIAAFDCKTLDADVLGNFCKEGLEFEVERDGAIDGFCGYFVTRLARGIDLDTAPGARPAFSEHLFFRTRPLAVRAGDRVTLTVEARGAEAEFPIFTLSGKVAGTPYSFTYNESHE